MLRRKSLPAATDDQERSCRPSPGRLFASPVARYAQRQSSPRSPIVGSLVLVVNSADRERVLMAGGQVKEPDRPIPDSRPQPLARSPRANAPATLPSPHRRPPARRRPPPRRRPNGRCRWTPSRRARRPAPVEARARGRTVASAAAGENPEFVSFRKGERPLRGNGLHLARTAHHLGTPHRARLAAEQSPRRCEVPFRAVRAGQFTAHRLQHPNRPRPAAETTRAAAVAPQPVASHP